MSKRDDKKLPVHEAGRGPALKHNPFGALSHTSAPQAPAAAPASSAHAGAREPAAKATKPPKGRVVLRREKKHRGGKTVVIVTGLQASAQLSQPEIAELAQHLKQQLGCGGAVEALADDTQIVIQGDQPARVAELLRARGLRVDGVTS